MLKDSQRLEFIVEYQAWVQNSGNLYLVRAWDSKIIGEDQDWRSAIDQAIEKFGWVPKNSIKGENTNV